MALSVQAEAEKSYVNFKVEAQAEHEHHIGFKIRKAIFFTVTLPL